ncbi:MAG: HU family DNA-binding protein [Bryobacteraceae bacterium]|jgi:nucleoid DNA-binding protein
MKKSDLVQEVARQRGVAPGTAADQMDRAVNKLVRALRKGRPARLPGLGTILPGKRWVFQPEPHER